jgi:thiol-disulfide isomerase/thioredoxin/outer membrane lipoprotein-sorting protein
MLSPVVLLVSLAISQATSNSSTATDALALLNEVSQHYADAKGYHIEAVEERTSSNELSHDWQKTLVTAIVMPGGRYRFEGRSGSGSAIAVSDGTTRWMYHLDEHLYTQHPVSGTVSDKPRLILQEEEPLETAQRLVKSIVRLAPRLKSATMLPQETIPVNGQNVDCYVVRYSNDDFKTNRFDYKEIQTIWIDKTRKTVKKTVSESPTYLIILGSEAHVPLSVETTTIYPVVKLDPTEPDGTFTLVPPADAKLVAEFPSPISQPIEHEASELLGKPAPELRLKSPDGKLTTLSSYRGKPVFIEFWATWCGSCVDLMPDLMKLYAETAQKGLVWLSIDDDKDASEAAAFISEDHIPWPNYHDDDGSLGKAFQRNAIPLGVLVDADGKVIFCKSGYDISQLRAAVAKLGPQFSSTAPQGTSSK